MAEKKMMRLKNFCEEYDIPRQTALDMIYSAGFPAYKMGARWYVDIPKFLKWREMEHRRSCRFA